MLGYLSSRQRLGQTRNLQFTAFTYEEVSVFSKKTQLYLTIVNSDADAEQDDQSTRRLIRQLRELGAESVEQTLEADAHMAIKGDAFTLGALALVALPAFLPKLVEFLQAWTLRGENRVVKIRTSAGLEVEFTPENQFSQDELLALVEKLDEAHVAGGAVDRS